MRPREQLSLAPPAALAGAPAGVHPAALAAGAEAAAAAVKLEGQLVAVLVETVVETYNRHVVGHVIAVAGRSGIEEVYGVPYLDVGCDVWFHVCRVHHFSPLVTAIRRRE